MEAENSESVIFRNWPDSGDSTNFENIELIHEGAFADTFRARRAGKLFLLKAVHNADSAFLHIIRREYELSVGLSHPNIVSSIAFEEASPVGPCIVMEYVDGVTLSEFLSHSSPASSRRRLLNQLLSAVDYLHAKGIVHNDLKPGNIMVSVAGDRLKLIDFGLADDDAHFLSKSIGYTLDFASPELREGLKTDARSDIWSLGRIIALMFPGRMRAISRRCCRIDTEKRYPSVGDLRKALSFRRNVLFALGITAVPAIAASLVFLTVSHNAVDAKILPDPGYETIFQQTLDEISDAATGIEASECIATFVKNFTAARDSVLDLLPEDCRDGFLSESENALDEMTGRLCIIEQALAPQN